MSTKLNHLVETVNILNIDTALSKLSAEQFISTTNPNYDKYIVSDVDEELLILIEFNQPIDLDSIKIHTLEHKHDDLDMSNPKEIHIYKIKNMNITFDDIKTMKPDKSVSIKTSSKVKNINLKKNAKNAIKFKTIKYVAIYVSSNQNDTEVTYFNAIIFKGKDKEKLEEKSKDKHKDTHKKEQPIDKKRADNQSTNLMQQPLHALQELCEQLKTNNNNDMDKPASTEVSCNFTKENCPYLKQLVTFLHEYKVIQTELTNDEKKEKVENYDDQTLSDILEDYLHSIDQHSSDVAFEYIFNQLQICQVGKCEIFKRNHRDRNKTNQFQYDNDILDKIHCYYCHSVDTGHRLLIQDRNSILEKDDITHTKPVSNQDWMHNLLTDTDLIALKQKLAVKQQTNHNICSKINDTINNKFNSLLPNENESVNSYSFGFAFKYGYDGENTHTFSKIGQEDGQIDMIPVHPKYTNLKTELTCNPIATLTIDAFNNEYKKASLHHNSYYCKKQFPKYMIKLENIIALMVYCNFTNLQYEFSKTYRTENGANHNNFYYLGKYLKIAVKIYGTVSSDAEINRFYHGIGDKLIFPGCINSSSNHSISGVFIHSPLSTTSCWEVAANFTNNNHGLIVELTGWRNMQPRYFSMSWLSDFPVEKEYFFIQCSSLEPLVFNNITDATTGKDYRHIVNALKYIEHIIGQDPAPLEAINSQLVTAILSHQLSKCSSKYVSFNVNDVYLNEMCNAYCQNKTYLCFDYQTITWKYSFIKQFLAHSVHQHEWIDIKSCHMLFPNLTQISIKNANFVRFIFLDILLHLDYLNKSKSSLKLISINEKTATKSKMNEYLNAFSWSLQKQNVLLTGEPKSLALTLRLNHSILESAVYLITHFNYNLYFKDSTGEITKTMQSLIKCKSDNFEQDTESKDQQKDMHEAFDAKCMKIGYFTINWDYIILNKDSFVFQTFYIEQYQWLNMNVIHAIFPKVKEVTIGNINLCQETLDAIFNYLTSSEDTLDTIRMSLKSDSTLNGKECLMRYK
eukprot:442610_1